MQSQKIAVISRWNVEGALQSPICITWLLNVPSTVANAVLWTCSSMMRICSYALDISSFDRYAALAISLQMISWSGNGVTSLTVLSFCSRKSKTVHSLLFSSVCRCEGNTMTKPQPGMTQGIKSWMGNNVQLVQWISSVYMSTSSKYKKNSPSGYPQRSSWRSATAPDSTLNPTLALIT